MEDGGVIRTTLPLPPVDPASIVEADAAPATAVALRVRGREIPPLGLQPSRAAHLMGFFTSGDRTGKGHAGRVVVIGKPVHRLRVVESVARVTLLLDAGRRRRQVARGL